MHLGKNLLILLLFISPLTGLAQHYRGMSVVSDKIVWLSGSKGRVVRTTNGGRKWDTLNPKGYEKKDFRDIHAWNAKEAVIMSAGDSAVFLKTRDGGKSWKLVYVNNSAGVFFDAIDFAGNNGMAISDPFPHSLGRPVRTQSPLIANTFLVIYSKNRGETWQMPTWYVFPTDPTESMFAASGSILYVTDTTNGYVNGLFVTGGISPACRNTLGTQYALVPLMNGPGKGVYSFCRDESMVLCAVGGDYKESGKRDSVAAFSTDSGKTWQLSFTQPGGYRSCVCYIPQKKWWICTGTNGSDISRDAGINWTPIQAGGYNVCACSRKYIWFAGQKGTWKKIKLKRLK